MDLPAMSCLLRWPELLAHPTRRRSAQRGMKIEHGGSKIEDRPPILDSRFSIFDPALPVDQPLPAFIHSLRVCHGRIIPFHGYHRPGTLPVLRVLTIWQTI